MPFTAEVVKFIEQHDRIYVVELNRDGQMHQLLELETPQNASKIISLAHIDGLPLSAEWVVNGLLDKEAK